MGQGSGLGAAGAVGGRSRHEPVVKEGRVSVVFDAPTELARDSDDPRAEGAVGIKGAPLDSIEDMASLLEGMRLEELDVSLMASTGNTSIVLAYFIAVAQERGIPLESLSGYAPRGRSATGRAPRVCRAAAVAWRF
jgi:methylmalonyl-CoA mutase N-terminal domain/subunit